MNRFLLLLGTCFLCSSSLVHAQFVPLSDADISPEEIFNSRQLSVTKDSRSTLPPAEVNTESSEGGSETVANILKFLEPNIDTSLPETHSQAAIRINQLISAAKYDLAITEINKFKKNDYSGTDVQLLFLEARAYAAKGDTGKAISIYREMTFNFPELAEPWNNMGALQLKIGSIEEAYSSLETALNIRPNYTIANQNIGLIYIALAKQAFEKAAVNGSRSAKTKVQQLQSIMNGK